MSEKMLVKKLAKVMQEVKYIQKKGENKFHKYKYATEADVAEKVREVLAEASVIMIPNMKSHSVREHTNKNGNREYIVTVDMEFTFMDGESGESITFSMAGEGQDSGDKGIYKAMTGAQKYALMKAFMIPTGDDPEEDATVDERNGADKPTPISSKQVGLIKVRIKELEQLGGAAEAIFNALKVKVGDFNQLTDMTAHQASKSIEWLNAWKEKKEEEKKGA
jgi:hypothetical protein